MDSAGGDKPKEKCRDRELDGDERKVYQALSDVGVKQGEGLVVYAVGLLLPQAQSGCRRQDGSVCKQENLWYFHLARSH